MSPRKIRNKPKRRGKPRKKTNPNKHFDEWWNQSMDAQARVIAYHHKENHRLARLEFEARTKIIRNFRKRIYHLLKDSLESISELLDLLSGFGRSVVPLVLDGTLDKLTLVEQRSPASLCIKKLKGIAVNQEVSVTPLASEIAERISLTERLLGPDTQTEDLPNISNVSLLATGLVFDPDHRDKKNRHDKYARGHIRPDDPLKLKHILNGLDGHPRTLHIADVPPLNITNAVRCSRQYVEQVLQDSPGDWKISEWKKDQQSPIVLGRLTN